MPRSSLSLVSCFALLFSLTHCSSTSESDGTPGAGSGNRAGAPGGGGTPAAPPLGGGGTSPGTGVGGSGNTGAVTNPSAGLGGSNATPGGGGAPPASGQGGAATTIQGGTVTSTPGGAGPLPTNGGTGGSGTPTGSAGAAPNPNAPDQNGKTNAKAGTTSDKALDYLKLGEIRVINNNWGSAELGCGAASTMSVFVREDKSFGWTFNRQNCDTGNTNAKPDFPQVEFGIHPFGIGNDLATSPEFSSTTLLPRQIKDITSATVKVDTMSIQLQKSTSWNITFEFWLSQQNPTTPGNAGVYAELMTFWGWQPNRWPDSGMMPGPIGPGGGDIVAAGGKSYKLWVQRDDWADGKWRYFQFRDNGGSSNTFNGTLDVKPLLDYLVNNRGYSRDLWVTRLEVGSEIDDETQGTVSFRNITFEVNGQSRSAEFGQ